jgi:replicative DNA helicase
MTDEKLPPHNQEAETAVLGGVLIDNDVFHEISDVLSHEDFYIGKNKTIYKAMADMLRDSVAVDFVTLLEVLRRRGLVDEPYIIDLINAVPTSINTRNYARIVRDLSIKRRLISAGQKIAQCGFDESTPTDQIVASAEAALFEVTEKAVNRSISDAKTGMHFLFEETQNRANNGAKPVGLPTGFTDLDKILKGLDKQAVHLLAGRPGMGKSSLERAIVLNAAKNGKRVVSFNLEMGREQIWRRTVSIETGIPLERIKDGNLMEHEWKLFGDAVGRLAEYQMWLDDDAGATLSQITAKCRRLHAEYGLDLITIDYVGLMRTDSKYVNRVQEIGEISRGIKRLAKSLNVPIIALAQLNRGLESRQDKRPELSDLRDSGDLEQDADVVMFVYRDEYYNPDDTDRPNVAEILVKKNRDGVTGQADLYWNGKSVQFKNLARQEINL